MRDLYAKGALPQEFSTIRPTQAQELFESGKAAAYQRNIWRAWSFEQNIKKVYPDAEVIVIAPQGPDGHHALRNTPGIFGVLMIAKSVPEEKVKRILDFFEYTNTPEFFDFIFFGIEGVHHNLVDGYPVMTEQGNIEVGTSATTADSARFQQLVEIVRQGGAERVQRQDMGNGAKLGRTRIL